jgi:hypothetical protein
MWEKLESWKISDFAKLTLMEHALNFNEIVILEMHKKAHL